MVDQGLIMAGIDGSEPAVRAAKWAAREALARRVPLKLVHATPQFDEALRTTTVPPKAYFDLLEDEGTQALHEAEEAVRAAYPDLDLHTELLRGLAVPALVEASREAQLFVLGPRGQDGFTELLIGSTAIALTHRGHCPVAIVRPRPGADEPPTDGPVVVGVDGSPSSEAAIALAFQLASSREAELVAVHTWVHSAVFTYPTEELLNWEAIQQAEESVLAERLAGWRERYPDVPVRRVVVQDRPVRYLVEASETAQLLVVGSRGLGGVRGMLLGSTSQALMHHTQCPLIVARPDTDH